MFKSAKLNEMFPKATPNKLVLVNHHRMAWLVRVKLDCNPRKLAEFSASGKDAYPAPVRTIQQIIARKTASSKVTLDKLDRIAYAMARQAARIKWCLGREITIDELVTQLLDPTPLTMAEQQELAESKFDDFDDDEKTPRPTKSIEKCESILGELLQIIRSTMDSGPWWTFVRNRPAVLTEEQKRTVITTEIGWLQEQKWEDPSRQLHLVPMDEGHWLLESTFEVLKRAVEDYYDLKLVCETIIKVLYEIEDLRLVHTSRGVAFDHEFYLLKVRPTITPQLVYIFMLYWTYRRLRTPETGDNTRLVNRLLRGYPLFATLEAFPAGITALFVEFHGGLFPDAFSNIYWQPHIIKAGERISDLVKRYYRDVYWRKSFDDHVAALKNMNECLRPFGVDDLLDALAGQKITIPATRFTQYRANTGKHDAADAAPPPNPPPPNDPPPKDETPPDKPAPPQDPPHEEKDPPKP